MSDDNRRSTRTLLVAIACFWASLYLYVPILAPYAETVGVPIAWVGIIISSYGFSQLILRIPVGLWSDRLGRRRPFIVAAFVASALSGLLFVYSSGLGGLLTARALSGVSATMWVVITVLYSSAFPPEKAGYAMSIVTFVTTVTQLCSTLAGGLIAEVWGWKSPFWVATVVGAVGFVLTLRLREASTRPLGLSVRALAAVGREPSLLLVSGLGAIYQFNMFVTTYGFTPNYAVALGASKAELGWLGLVSTLPMALSSLGSGSLFAKRMNEGQMVTTGCALTCVGTGLIPLCDSLWSLYATQALAGFGRGLVFAVLMGLAIRTVPTERRATAMGFFQSIYAIGMFAGPAVAGITADAYGLNGAFYTAAAVMAVATLVAAGWLTRTFQRALRTPENVVSS